MPRQGGATHIWRAGGARKSSQNQLGGGFLGLRTGSGQRRVQLPARTGGAILSASSGSGGFVKRGGGQLGFSAGATVLRVDARTGGATCSFTGGATRMLIPTGHTGYRLLTSGGHNAKLLTRGRRDVRLQGDRRHGVLT